MPRVDPENATVTKNLSRYKITSLTLYGTGNRKVEIGRNFIEWLTNELQPIVEFISLKNLNLCDLDGQIWTKFLTLCSSNCKFSACLKILKILIFNIFKTINCTFPRLSMLYQLYERRPMFDYLTETYTTTFENDIPIESFEQRNRQILQSLVDGNACSVDLSSLFGLTLDLVLEFISVSVFLKI